MNGTADTVYPVAESFSSGLGQQQNPFQVVGLVIRDPQGRLTEMTLPTPLDIPGPFVVDGQLLAGLPAQELQGGVLGQAPGGFLDFFGKLITTAGGAFAADRAAKAAAEAAEAQRQAAQAQLEAERLRAQAERERVREVEAVQIIPGIPNFLTVVGGVGILGTLAFIIFG